MLRAPRAFLFDRWLGNEQPWYQEWFACPDCEREFVVVYRCDKYPVCPWCTLTDRADIIHEMEEV